MLLYEVIFQTLPPSPLPSHNTDTDRNCVIDTTVVQLTCINPDITLYRMENVVSNREIDWLIEVGWIIITNWIDDVRQIRDVTSVVAVTGVSFRLARDNARLTVTADIDVFMPAEMIPNVDADEPGSGGRSSCAVDGGGVLASETGLDRGLRDSIK